MLASTDKPIPWRERAFLTQAEVAAIFGVSTTWVHNRLTDGSLSRARIPAGGSVRVTVASVIELIDAAEPVRDEPVRFERPARRTKGLLRLVACNDC